jgi:autotransporter-associated beta strand protein
VQIDGVISGSNLTVYGESTVILTGTNTYAGRTRLNEATLLVNGHQPFSTIVLEGNLGGTGRTGPIVGRRNPGTLNPGSNGVGVLSVGVLSVGDLSLNAFCQLALELNGGSPGTYDQLQVYGTVHLDNAALNVRLGYDPTSEESFVVIMNDGSDPITGHFLNLPEGAVVDANGRQLDISYAGGDGNDVVLTPIHAPPSVILSIATETSGQVRITGAGISNLQYVLQVATNLPPRSSWEPIASTAAAPDGSYSFIRPRDEGATVFFRVQTMSPYYSP